MSKELALSERALLSTSAILTKSKNLHSGSDHTVANTPSVSTDIPSQNLAGISDFQFHTEP